MACDISNTHYSQHIYPATIVTRGRFLVTFLGSARPSGTLLIDRELIFLIIEHWTLMEREKTRDSMYFQTFDSLSNSSRTSLFGASYQERLHQRSHSSPNFKMKLLRIPATGHSIRTICFRSKELSTAVSNDDESLGRQHLVISENQ